jgi:hypothetical protein
LPQPSEEAGDAQKGTAGALMLAMGAGVVIVVWPACWSGVMFSFRRFLMAGAAVFSIAATAQAEDSEHQTWPFA